MMGQVSRRAMLGTLASGLLIHSPGNARAQTVRWSAGSERPKTKAPANATDCHHHILSKHYPLAPGAPSLEDASIEDYRLLQKRLGTSRHVIVQSSIYGTDNSIIVDSLKAFGPEARGVAVVDTSVTDTELKRLHDAGVRGIRFVLIRGNATSTAMLKPLSQRVNELGWHIDIHAPGNSNRRDRRPAQCAPFADRIRPSRPYPATRGCRASGVQGTDWPARQGTNLDEAFRHLSGQQVRPTELCRHVQTRSHFRQAVAGARDLGHRLAASQHEQQTGRRAVVRRLGGTGSGRKGAASGSGREPGGACSISRST